MSVRVTYVYEPDEPDDKDPTGVSEDEFLRVTEFLMTLGAEDIQLEKE